MKSWYDLTKQEQKILKKDFNCKKKTGDLIGIILLVISLAMFIFPIFPLIMSQQNDIGIAEIRDRNLMIFSIIDGIIFLVAVLIITITNIIQSKSFKSWLYTKNIIK